MHLQAAKRLIREAATGIKDVRIGHAPSMTLQLFVLCLAPTRRTRIRTSCAAFQLVNSSNCESQCPVPEPRYQHAARGVTQDWGNLAVGHRVKIFDSSFDGSIPPRHSTYPRKMFLSKSIMALAAQAPQQFTCPKRNKWVKCPLQTVFRIQFFT